MRIKDKIKTTKIGGGGCQADRRVVMLVRPKKAKPVIGKTKKQFDLHPLPPFPKSLPWLLPLPSLLPKAKQSLVIPQTSNIESNGEAKKRMTA